MDLYGLEVLNGFIKNLKGLAKFLFNNKSIATTVEANKINTKVITALFSIVRCINKRVTAGIKVNGTIFIKL